MLIPNSVSKRPYFHFLRLLN